MTEENEPLAFRRTLQDNNPAGDDSMGIQEHVRAEEDLGVALIQYAGRWVAVQDHQVVDDDESLGCLVDRLNGLRETAEIFRVQEEPTTGC